MLLTCTLDKPSTILVAATSIVLVAVVKLLTALTSCVLLLAYPLVNVVLAS